MATMYDNKIYHDDCLTEEQMDESQPVDIETGVKCEGCGALVLGTIEEVDDIEVGEDEDDEEHEPEIKDEENR